MTTPRAEGGARAGLTLENLGDLVTVKEAAAATRLSGKIIKGAINAGELAAFIPGGRDKRKAGRGMGWRIRKIDLQDWFFSAMRGES